MNQMKIIGIAMLVGGAILLIMGFNATGAPTEKITETLTGQYSDRTTMYLIGGGILAVVGLVLTVKK